MKRALAALLLSTASVAQPSTVVYQGFLVDSAGNPVEGDLDLVFSLHSTQTGGTPIWSDPISGVTFSRGSFSVELGINQADLAQDDLWLELAVAGDVLAPRQPIASAPWALVCGRAERLGGLGAAAYQARVTGTCPGLGEVVRGINADGSVICEVDDVGGGSVVTVTGGAGVSTTGSSAVTVDVNQGAGVLANADSLALDFAGTGSALLAARDDHDHGGLYVPQGGSLTCDPGLQAYELDPSGNLFCDIDANNLYGVGGSGNMQFDGSEFSLAPTLFLAQLTAASYHLTSPKVAYYTVHPAEFDPDDSGGGSYYSTGSFGRVHGTPPLSCPNGLCDGGETPCNCPSDCFGGCGSGTIMAALNLPQRAQITQMDLLYDLQDPAGGIACFLDVLDASTGALSGGFSVNGPFSTPGVVTTASTAVSLLVDNQTKSYVLDCSMYDPASFMTTIFYGVRITYTFTEIVR